ncbi:MAG: DUF1667 domain-containing protein [Bacilli bacterium]|jgi:CxxC motif-containing protein|nr:DUF1667 domain-containing protein [Bacilli bacterium]
MPDLICIVCPRGCHLKVENGQVTGNFCNRGVQYGLQEATHPVRMVTSTITIRDGVVARLPVATSKPIPKWMMFDVIREISKVEITAPIYIGTPIIENVLNTGANIIATRSIERSPQ